MLGLIARHSLLAICGAVLLEEIGIPMPIPSDLLIVSAGAQATSWGRFLLWFVLLSLASASGASVLYAAIRRGGRPLVDRAGRYIHLGPETLARGEALLARSGWGGIVLGRATPGLRLPTVVVCGLLGVPYRRFITAHITGSAVYILAFLAIGRIFGPAVLDRIHLPRLSLRLLGLLALALGLPILLAWWDRRLRTGKPVPSAPRPRPALGTAGFAGFVGVMVFAAAWSAGETLTHLARGPEAFIPGYRAVARLAGRIDHPHDGFLLGYALLLLAGIALAILHLELLAPSLAARGRATQIAPLALAVFLLGGAALLLGQPGQLAARACVLALGSAAYATTVVCIDAIGRALVPARR